MEPGHSTALGGPGWLAWGLASAGTLAMAASPFLPNAQPLLNNYIPILDQPVFMLGLGLCGLGFGLAILRTLVWGWGTASMFTVMSCGVH